MTSPLDKLVTATTEAALAFLRTVDPDAAADIDIRRREEPRQPSFVIVGETKRGKSSLVNALIGIPHLSPVDAAVTTAAYLEFVPGPAPAALAHIPGQDTPTAIDISDLRDWGTILGRLPDGIRPPRRIEISHTAPLLAHLTLIDTPGTGGLDPNHVDITLDAVTHATALVFVVDAAAPLSQPELDFLIEASKRVNTVVFALTKTDAYPGWRTILADNKAQLQAHAPRFANTQWYPVSARLAELAITVGGAAATELIGESRIGELQQAMLTLAGAGQSLRQANILRALRTEVIRLDLAVGARIRATDPDPADMDKAKTDRSALAARKRTETRQWTLGLSTETQRARVEATTRLRNLLTEVQEGFLERIDKGGRDDLKTLPEEVDRALHALSIRLSQDLEHRFHKVAERALADVFPIDDLQHVLRQLNATLRHTLGTKPRRDGGGPDNVMIAMSAGGMAFMAGRGAVVGVSALGIGTIAGASLLIPFAGVGLGLAAGAFIIYRRRVQTDRQQARSWLREVLGEARAALSDEIMHRFTDLQYGLTLALDEAIERRRAQLDTHIADIDKAMAQDKAARARRRAALQQERDALRVRLKQIDETLVRVRQG